MATDEFYYHALHNYEPTPTHYRFFIGDNKHIAYEEGVKFFCITYSDGDYEVPQYAISCCGKFKVLFIRKFGIEILVDPIRVEVPNAFMWDSAEKQCREH